MKLILKKDADVCLFLLSEGENQSFIITGDEKIETEYEEKRISPNDSISVVKTGISCLHIKNTGEESEIDFSYSAGISPFIVPGPGIMPRDRLDKQTFWFPADFAGQFYIYVPEHTGNVCFSTYSGYASDDAVVFSLQPDNGKSVLNRWLPEKKKRAPWQTCEENGNGWWCARKIRGGQDFRVSEWNGLVVFFKKPECDVPYSYLIPENTQKKDYRICIIRNGHMESAQDILYSEKVRIPFIAGTVDVISSAGYCFSEQKTQLHAVQ